MDSQPLLAAENGGIGTLIFNRPEKKNALSPEMLVHMHAVLTKWADEQSVRCVVISGGEGGSFCSGFDISAIPTHITPEMKKLLQEHNPLELALGAVRSFPFPTIAQLNGHCFGAGLHLSICCDIRVAAGDILLGMPPARLGLVYHAQGLADFVDTVGMAATRELFLTGRTLSARQAQEIGLVHHLAPRTELEAFTGNLARETAACAPLSLKGMKKILNMLQSRSRLGSQDLAEAQQLQAEAFASGDFKEGQMAFLSKRKPVFKGR